MKQYQESSRFMARLARDRRGNTLAIMAAMLIPLAGFCGVAIDTARLYVVKTRLQQACDAGVLAGRKFMTDTSTSNTTLDSTASARAQEFFKNNFNTGWFRTASATFTATKTVDAQVAGSAQSAVPMTIMAMFGMPSQTITVTCEARFDVADTDVMFVLDTTGSMACLPQDSDSTCNSYVGANTAKSYSRPADGSASGNLSVAGYPGSTAYYVPENSGGSRIAALRTAVLNFYDTMASSADPTTHIRYGFVTYTSTVNAGKAIMDLSPAYMVGGSGSANTQWNYESREATGTYSNGKPNFYYSTRNLDVRSYVAGNSVTDPSKVDGTVNRWAGCIEERATTAGTMNFNQAALPADLDPDLVPNSNIDTQWRPMWPEVFYARWNYGSRNTVTATGDTSSHPNIGSASYMQLGYVSCGKPVSRLAEMSKTQVSNYVNATDFRPLGGTYHDTGMIWGTRMLSPSGPFKNDTKAWPNRPEPNRVIVFLTDGDMSPSLNVYGMYANEYYDRLVSGGDTGNLKAYHNARFLAACAAAKARNIQVWTVAIDSSATDEMKACATTPSQALATTSGTGLSTAFASIAKQVAMLRVSK